MTPADSEEIPLAFNTVPIYGAEEIVIIDDEMPVDERGFSDQETDFASPVFRDPVFGIIFICHILLLVLSSIFVAPEGYENINFNFTYIEDEMRDGDDFKEEDIKQFEEFFGKTVKFVEVYPSRIVKYLVVPCHFVAFLCAFIVTSYVIRPLATLWTKICLAGTVFTVVMATILSVVASKNGAIVVLGLIGVGLSLYFVVRAWRLVPFAGVNLKVALCAANRNFGMYFIAFVFAHLGICWIAFWVYTLVGVFSEKYHECMVEHPENEFGADDDECGPPAPVVIGFLVSLYWTSAVLMNTVQVTVAGTTATWAYAKEEAQTCCSPAVGSSLFRSMTYSFGSICLGSLLEAIVSTVRQIVDTAKREREQMGGREGCISIYYLVLECCAKCCEDLLEYFNTFAWCYVGIYGYSYVKSGQMVYELFKRRGWTTIVTNGLVSYVLATTTFFISVITGCAAILMEHITTSVMAPESNTPGESFLFGPITEYKLLCFLIGFIIGAYVSSLMMNVVKGAVNTVIICWADNPWAMKENHPRLTKELTEAWRKVFPEIQVEPRGAAW